jgi:RNA polymerase sigma-70 factor (ECF subfamily)
VGHAAEDAKDLTQEFFARLLEKKWLAEVDRQRGRFRSFLLAAMNHFLANEWRRGQTIKRGGGRSFISLDDAHECLYEGFASANDSPERLYDRRWALDLFDRALGQLHRQYADSGKAQLYEHLKEFLSSEPGDGQYAKLAEQLSMTTGAIAAAVHRLRQRYRELVRQQVAQTLADPAEFEDEMRSLLAALT